MSSFKLTSSDPDFKNRQKKVFDQLLVLENNRKNATSEETQNNERRTSNNSRSQQKKETRHFRGKESIFKKPQNPAPKNYINKIPDFKKHPHKWTKYSLEDVQDMTDESNTKSAMDFLRELANRRKMEQGLIEEKLEELPDKIVFNKHARTSTVRERTAATSEDTEVDKASFNSSKLVMPEYVIGQKPVKKAKPSKKTKPEKGRELKLDHLMDEED